jgi:hypothetical protein
MKLISGLLRQYTDRVSADKNYNCKGEAAFNPSKGKG